jgi:serine/threonine-protein kinase
MNRDAAGRWVIVEAWLDRALDQPEPTRLAWVASHCDDPALRDEVLALLRADAAQVDRLESRAAAAHAQLAARAAAWPEVPGYRMLRLLGEGGMASVFLAERTLGGTVQRVAIKRLRLNVYDHDERRRFAHEHRMLARVEHPGIARLIDAGIAPDGVPWFAMEYVDGAPLLAWCDARRLDAAARLMLLEEVCAAVQHAHQHLVVHRDLKPSNILVNHEGRVKVLDFGIARLLDTDTGAPGAPTRTGLRRLTPGYAAPEQYDGLAGTAADVYALGVILVELVSGKRPTCTPDTDPLRGLAVDAADAESRASSPRILERLLAGDVGAIARKALRPDPADRYGSALALAGELAAVRAGRPVQARRGDWRYRTRCFLHRNAAPVAAGAFVAAALIGATAFSLFHAHRAREQAERAQAVQAFVEDLLAPLREGVPRERLPPLDALLAEGLARLDRDGKRDPAVHSELLVMFARTYDHMGEIETARDLAQRAHAHSLAAFGTDDPRTVQALAMRGRMHARFGDREQAQADLADAHARMRRQGTGGEALAMVLDDLGALALARQSLDDAAALFGAAQREREALLPPTHSDLAIGPANLGDVADARGDKIGALALYREAVRHHARQTDTRLAATHLSRSGLLQCELGRFRAGSEDYLRALSIFDRLDARDHPDRLWVLARSCSAFIFLDELARAEQDCDASVAMAERLYGHDSRQHLTTRTFRMKVLAAQGRLAESHAEAARVRASLEADGMSPGEDTFLRRALSDTLALEDDPVALRDTLLPLMADARLDPWIMAPTLIARTRRACTLAPSPRCPGDLEARLAEELAEPQFRDNALTIEPHLELARIALHDARADVAEHHLDAAAQLAELPHAALAPDHRWMLEARLLRGDVAALRGDREGARRDWQAAATGFARRYGEAHPQRRAAKSRLTGRSTALAE